MNIIEKARAYDRIFIITGFGLTASFALLYLILANRSIEGLMQLFPLMLILGVVGLMSSAHSLTLYRRFKKSFGDNSEEYY